MTATETDTQWPQSGDAVVILGYNGRSKPVLTDTTVDRVLKTVVVTADERRFRRSDLRAPGPYDYNPQPRLLHPDDPSLPALRAEQRQRRSKTRATRAYEQWRKDTTTEHAEQVADAFARLGDPGAPSPAQRLAEARALLEEVTAASLLGATVFEIERSLLVPLTRILNH